MIPSVTEASWIPPRSRGPLHGSRAGRPGWDSRGLSTRSVETTAGLPTGQQTSRRAYLVELDPLDCDVVVERHTTLSGQEAQRG